MDEKSPQIYFEAKFYPLKADSDFSSINRIYNTLTGHLSQLKFTFLFVFDKSYSTALAILHLSTSLVIVLTSFCFFFFFVLFGQSRFSLS